MQTDRVFFGGGIFVEEQKLRMRWCGPGRGGGGGVARSVERGSDVVKNAKAYGRRSWDVGNGGSDDGRARERVHVCSVRSVFSTDTLQVHICMHYHHPHRHWERMTKCTICGRQPCASSSSPSQFFSDGAP